MRADNAFLLLYRMVRKLGAKNWEQKMHFYSTDRVLDDHETVGQKIHFHYIASVQEDS